MAINAGTVFVDVKPDMSAFGSSLSGQMKSSSGLGSSMSKMTKALIAIPIAGAIVAGIASIASALADWTAQAADAKATANSLRTGLRSMGWVANVSAEALLQQNEQLSIMSAIDDDLITEGTTLLATFGNIRNEVGRGNDMFTQANALMVDLAAKFTDGNMTSAATMLGKALDNPIKGITALSRVGVSFSDAEIKMIETAMKHNDVLAAQKVLMGALHKQVDGAAKAGATGAEKLSNAWAQFTEWIGTILLPYVNDAMKAFRHFFKDVTGGTKNLGDAWNNLVDRLRVLWETKLKPGLIQVWNQILDALQAMFDAWLSNMISSMIERMKQGFLDAIPGSGLVGAGIDVITGGDGSTSDTPTGKGGSAGTTERPIVIEDHTTDGVTARERHSSRQARSQR